MSIVRKRRTVLFRVLMSILAVGVTLVAIWIIIVIANRPKRTLPNTDDWQTGDIFFSVGDSWKSVAVRSLSGFKKPALVDSVPSHCGIVIMDSCGPLLVHASTTAKRIVAESPADYMEINGSYCLYAMKPPCALDTAKLRNDVDSLLRNEVPFDFDFRHDDSSSLYCTEMVVELLESNGCGIVTPLRDKSYIYPQDMAKLCRPKGAKTKN